MHSLILIRPGIRLFLNLPLRLRLSTVHPINLLLHPMATIPLNHPLRPRILANIHLTQAIQVLFGNLLSSPCPPQPGTPAGCNKVEVGGDGS